MLDQLQLLAHETIPTFTCAILINQATVISESASHLFRASSIPGLAVTAAAAIRHFHPGFIHLSQPGQIIVCSGTCGTLGQPVDGSPADSITKGVGQGI